MAIKTKKRTVDATEGPIFSKMVSFVIPLMLTNLIQQLYSMADSIVVGRFSGDPNALAAIGSTSTFIAFFTALMTGFAAGTGVIIACSFGARNNRELSRGVHTSILFGIIVGLLLALIAFLAADPMLVILKTKPELFDKAKMYIWITCIGIPALSVYNFSAAILRSVGDSKTPFYALTASGIANIILNLLFVIVLRMSIAGVAVATVISQYLAAAVVILTLIRRKSDPYYLNLRKLSIDRGSLIRILRLGVPAAIQGSLFGITNFFLIATLNTFPTPVISARTIATNIDVLLSTAINTYLHVTMTFTGQNYGARKHDRIKKSLLYALLQVVTIGVVIGQVMLIFYKPLVNLYLAPDDPNAEAVLTAAKTIMTVMLSSYFIGAINEALSGFLRGLGASVSPMVASILGICIFRLVWINFVYPYLNMQNTLVGLYLLYPISWTLTALALTVMCLLAWKKRVKPAIPQQSKLEFNNV